MTLARSLGIAVGFLLALAAPTVVLAAHGLEDPALTISADYLAQLRGAGELVVAIDLRPLDAFRQGHLPGARSLPFAELRARLDEIPRISRVVLYGTAPAEVSAAYAALRLRGYRNVMVLDGGFAGWTQRGLPVEHSR